MYYLIALYFWVTQGSPHFKLGDMVATGSVLSCDPTRAIVKRLLLSGHPYKIHKRGAVVRYMFHTPEDIEYFKVSSTPLAG